MNRLVSLCVFAMALSYPAAAQNVDVTYQRSVSWKDLDPSLPVTDADINDRPYRVIGTIQTGVRKATIFSKPASQHKIFRELWERGSRMGADAVILATAGDSHITAMSWGSTSATGKAIVWVQKVAPASTHAQDAHDASASKPSTD